MFLNPGYCTTSWFSGFTCALYCSLMYSHSMQFDRRNAWSIIKHQMHTNCRRSLRYIWYMLKLQKHTPKQWDLNYLKKTKNSLNIMLASVAVRSTFHRFKCFITPTMKPGALEANKYMPPNNFSINDPAMNMLKTWDVIETWTCQSPSMKQQLEHGTKACRQGRETKNTLFLWYLGWLRAGFA